MTYTEILRVRSTKVNMRSPTFLSGHVNFREILEITEGKEYLVSLSFQLQASGEAFELSLLIQFSLFSHKGQQGTIGAPGAFRDGDGIGSPGVPGFQGKFAYFRSHVVGITSDKYIHVHQ